MNPLIGPNPHQVPSNQMLGNLAYMDISSLLIVPSTGGIFTGDVGAENLNGGPIGGFRNILHNGDFKVWQRGTSGTTGAVYTADRWRLPGAAGQTWSRQADHPIYGAQGFSLEFTHTSGSQWIDQRIDAQHCRHLIGKVVTASIWIKNVVVSSLGSNLGISYCNTLNDFSATTSIAGTTSDTAVGVWTLHQATFTMPTGAANGLLFRIASSPASSSSTVRIANAQLEYGPYVTPFESRNYGLELAICQRFYCRINPTAANQILAVGHCNATTQAVVIVPFPVPMRAAPTLFNHSGVATDYAVTHAATSTVCSSSPTFSGTSPMVGRVAMNVASGLTVGRGAMARAQTTSGYFGFSADL